MALETVAIAVLSGGFVGVVYKSGQERTERFRERMFAAADDFLGAVQDASDALEAGVRSVDRVLRDQASFDELLAAEHKAALEAAVKAPEEVFAILKKLGRVFEELSHGHSDESTVGRIDAAATVVRSAMENLDEDDEEVARFRRALAQTLTAMERARSASRDQLALANEGRQTIKRVEHARPRLTLMFNGRRGGDAVLATADKLVTHFHDLRAAIVEDIEAERSASDDPRTGQIAGAIDEAAARFGAEVSSCVRRSWL